MSFQATGLVVCANLLTLAVDKQSVYVSATLTCVSESCPTCRAVASNQSESDEVTIGCSVRLGGNWSPSLQISWTGPPAVRAAVTMDAEDPDERSNRARTVGYHASFVVASPSGKGSYTTELIFDEKRRPTAASAVNRPSTDCVWQLSDTRASCKLWRSCIHNDHLSGTGRAVDPLCVSVCVSGQ